MTAPLIYVFATAAGVLIVFFVCAGVLAYRHARTRTESARPLALYIAAEPRTVDPAQPVLDLEALQRARSSVMHVTIGDLVRDPALAGAVEQAAAVRFRNLTRRR